MKEIDGKKLYTGKEVSCILGVSISRIKRAHDLRKLIPDDLTPSAGRYKFTYLYGEDTIKEYARKTGLNAVFENYANASKESITERKKRLEAQMKIEHELNPEDDNGIVITAENVAEIFGQSEPEYEELPMFVVRLGNGYISMNQISYGEPLILDEETANHVATTYGGKQMQVYLKEVA